MDVPHALNEWTLDIIEEIISKGIFETDAFDFKKCLPVKDDDQGKKRLRKTIAAFANSGGGFLVYGIDDDKRISGKDRMIGMDIAYDFPACFGNYPASCQPSVEWNFLNPPIRIRNKGNVLHICEIKSTWKRPHVIEEDRGVFIFPKRTNKGNEDMTYFEIKSAFQEAEYRRTKLALLISEIEHLIMSANRLLENVPATITSPDGTAHWAWATRYSTMLLDMVLGDAYTFISENPELWKLLCQIRESASYSNAICEAFSNVVYIAMDNRESIIQNQYYRVRGSATIIIESSQKAIDSLKKLLK